MRQTPPGSALSSAVLPNQNRGSAATALLRIILSMLEDSGVEYAVIHTAAGGEPDVSSDIDIAFADDPRRTLEPLLCVLAAEGKLKIIQKLHYDVPCAYYYVLLPAGESTCFLHLDCLYDPIGVNRYRLTTKYLLNHRQPTPWGHRVGDREQALYLLLKKSRKGSISASQLEELRRIVPPGTDGAFWKTARHYLGASSLALVQDLLASAEPESAIPALKCLRRSALAQFRWRHPVLGLRRLTLDAMRRLRRYLRPTGLFVVLVGPDGCGKSTLAEHLLTNLQRAFRKTSRFHWRPGLLPKLGRSSRSDAAPRAPDPANPRKYGTAVSLARFLYYWLDFVVGYWVVIYLRRGRTTLVIGERYFPDVLVHPERYAFYLPAWIMRLAARCVPNPDLVILLKDDPEAIHARKSELPVSTIASQLVSYELDLRRWGRAETVLTHQGADQVALEAGNLILDTCSSRTRRRLQIPGNTSRWMAFPNRNRPKLLIDAADSVASALKLYQPYSSLGSAVVSLFERLPDAWARLVLSPRIDPIDTKYFDLLSARIREVLNDSTLAVSFYTGTPGAHRKITAQASRGNEVLAYIKIANAPDTERLLRNEAEMLRNRRVRSLTRASAPEVLAFDTFQQHDLLFLKPPESAARKQSLLPGPGDAMFLMELAEQQTHAIAPDEFFRETGLTESITRLEPHQPWQAALLSHALDTVKRILHHSGINVGLGHGDYASWNARQLADGRLYVFDWEYAGNRLPALNDVLHRVFMPARLIDHESPATAIRKLLRIPENPLLSPIIEKHNVSDSDVPAYVLLYLATIAQREMHGTPHYSAYVEECLRRVLVYAGHPAHRLKVLVSAYACEPGGGSEPGVGWNMCQAISRDHEAWVITRRNNRPAIERALQQAPNPNLHFIYTDLPRWLSFWKKGGRGIRTYYYLWQFAALFNASRLNREIRFDLAHHVTFVNDWLFTFLALLPIPFIWGPIGSHPKIPWQLSADRGQLLADRLRLAFQQTMRVIDPLFWLSAARARLVIAIRPDIVRHFPLSLFCRSKFILHTAIGAEPASRSHADRDSASDQIHILSMGRLAPIKAFHITVLAFSRFAQTSSGARLTIVGKGPLKRSLITLAMKHGVEDRIEFVDWLPRPQALALMQKADIFLFPSFEAGGMVVLEALAAGVPVVCLDYGGPGSMVTEECGAVVAPVDIETTVSSLASALSRLSSNKAQLKLKGGAAFARFEDRYSWRSRHVIIREWYRSVLENYGVVDSDVDAEALLR